MSRLAPALDIERYGEYVARVPGDQRPLYRFGERVVAREAGRPEPRFAAEPDRYHVYAGWFCPWAQRVTIQVALNGLTDVVGVSYVDPHRDGRGWAFWGGHTDPVNGFALLRDAYEATEPGFDGHVCVPTLWDKQSGRVVSNSYDTIGLDVATQFRAYGDPAVDTYPTSLRAEIDQLDTWIGPAVNQGVGLAGHDTVEGRAARALLGRVLHKLDERLARQRYLTGPTITEADVRLFVTLVRFDVQANAERTIHDGLGSLPHLWAYARDLYAHQAFWSTTDFDSFARPGAVVPDWDELTDRSRLG